MSRLRWPDSTNSVSEKPGTIHFVQTREDQWLAGAIPLERLGDNTRRGFEAMNTALKERADAES